MNHRRSQPLAAAVEGILNNFRRYPLRIRTGESPHDVVWPGAVAAGPSSGRTFCDSLYLALAVGSGCPLVTADLRCFNAIRGTPWGRHCLWVEDLP